MYDMFKLFSKKSITIILIGYLLSILSCNEINRNNLHPDDIQGIQELSNSFKLFLDSLDHYMDKSSYDSAQLLLDQYALTFKITQPNIENYLLSTRQSEIYYYNNLHKLGLQEALQLKSIANGL